MLFLLNGTHGLPGDSYVRDSGNGRSVPLFFSGQCAKLQKVGRQWRECPVGCKVTLGSWWPTF